MAWPPPIYPPNRSNDDPQQDQHADDHNQISTAVTEIIARDGVNRAIIDSNTANIAATDAVFRESDRSIYSDAPVARRKTDGSFQAFFSSLQGTVGSAESVESSYSGGWTVVGESVVAFDVTGLQGGITAVGSAAITCELKPGETLFAAMMYSIDGGLFQLAGGGRGRAGNTLSPGTITPNVCSPLNWAFVPEGSTEIRVGAGVNIPPGPSVLIREASVGCIFLGR